MPFLGGRLWIDFLNTTPVIKGAALDLIETDDAIARWAEHANIPPVRRDVENDRPASLRVLRVALRDAFEQLAEGRALPDELIAEINRLIAGSGMSAQLVAKDDRIVREQRLVLNGPPVATAVAWDFAEFIDAYERERLRHCDNPECTMQFYDLGRNNRRRWCSMSVCGNRDKAAHYRERRAGRAG